MWEHIAVQSIPLLVCGSQQNRRIPYQLSLRKDTRSEPKRRFTQKSR